MIQSDSVVQRNAEPVLEEENDTTVQVQDILDLKLRKKPGTTARKSQRIKVLPYVDFRQIIGLVSLLIWPVFLGTVFNIFGIGEVSHKLKIDSDSAHFLQCANDTEEISYQVLAYQKALQARMVSNLTITADSRFLSRAIDHLMKFVSKCPEYSAIALLTANTFENLPERQALYEEENMLLSLVVELSETAISSRMLLVPPMSVGQDRGGMTWNNVLQKLIQSDMELWLEELLNVGGQIYDYSPYSQQLLQHFVEHYARVMIISEVFQKYAMPEFRIDKLREHCTDCNWSGYRSKDYHFWWDLLPSLVKQGQDTTDVLRLHDEAVKAGVPDMINTTGMIAISNKIISEMMYFPNKTKGTADKLFGQEFANATETLHILLAVALLAFIVLTPLLVSMFVMFVNSLMRIFAESYRFQWIQLCRKRAIEREKLRSDRVISEMFFEVNFKYLFQKTLPPMVLYKETTVAFVEFMEYEELCKIYDVAYHISLLDWYYRLVSNAVKGFNCSLVATTGHYCLLAAIQSYHGQTMALAMMRLMALSMEINLPAPNSDHKPLIKAGMHSGPMAGAIVSLKFPLFTMLGDTVNTASRMNSKSRPYQILMSERTMDLISDNFKTTPAGEFSIKGKGRMKAFWLISCNWTAFNSFTVDASQTNALAKQDALFQKVSEAQKHTRSGHGSNLSAGGSHSNSPLLGGIGTGNSLRSHRSRSKRKSQVNVEKSSTKRLSITIATGIRPEVARSTKHYSGMLDVRLAAQDSYYIQVSHNDAAKKWNPKSEPRTNIR